LVDGKVAKAHLRPLGRHSITEAQNFTDTLREVMTS
jgi:hypothetical protein